jgi:UDP-3-O-[3-hydroxymyristoyl] N-acetylglucosamine deacetylase
LDNAVGIAGDKVLNIGGLRYADEFVRHKLLDAVGDLSLAGMPLLGRFHGHRAGHAVNNQLLRALLAKPEAWTVVELPALEETRFEQVRASA